MQKLIKKILTDKKTRNVAAMSAFLLTVVDTGAAWS